MKVSARLTKAIKDGEVAFSLSVSVKDFLDEAEADKVLAEVMEALGQQVLA